MSAGELILSTGALLIEARLPARELLLACCQLCATVGYPSCRGIERRLPGCDLLLGIRAGAVERILRLCDGAHPLLIARNARVMICLHRHQRLELSDALLEHARCIS